MRKYLLYFLLGYSALLVGCATPSLEQRFVAASEGLPKGEQWKCNPAFGDVNGDGLLDLAAIPRKGEGARVWINQGNKTWSESSEGLKLPSSCGGGTDFGDVNQDGYFDLVVGDHCHGLFVYTSDGTGKWALLSKDLPPLTANDVTAADFNGDGYLDLAACSANDKGLHLFYGNGKGDWKQAESSGLSTSDDCNELVSADFNHDGIPDLAATMISRPRVWISVEKGKWRESSAGLPDTSDNGGQYWGVAVGDVNQDGHLDLALGRIVKGPEVYLGDGKGGWQPALSGLSEVQSAWGVSFGDVNGDGFLDLAVSGTKGRDVLGNVYGVFLFRGNGKGEWEFLADSGLPPQGLYQSWGLVLANIDNDSLPEIGACFGDEAAQFSSDLKEKYPNRKFGSGGSLRVWKQE